MPDDLDLIIDLDSDTSEPMGPWCWCNLEHTEDELAGGKCARCGKPLMHDESSPAGR